MSSSQVLKFGVRPDSPAATSWFEFLLNPQLLEQHLENKYAIPGAHQLIIQFLQQAHALEISKNDVENLDSTTGEQNGVSKDEQGNLRLRARWAYKNEMPY